jgi:hypothetical protein
MGFGAMKEDPGQWNAFHRMACSSIRRWNWRTHIRNRGFGARRPRH